MRERQNDIRSRQIAELRRDFLELIQLLLHVAEQRAEGVQIPERKARERIYGPLWD